MIENIISVGSIHARRYSPFRTLASLIRHLHSSLFAALLLHPLIPRSCRPSMYQRPFPFPYSQVVVCLLIPSKASLRFSEHRFFSGVESDPHAQPPTWRTRVSLHVWAIPFDVSGLGDPASSCATASIALRIIWPHKPHHYVKVRTPSGGPYLVTASFIVVILLCTSLFSGIFHHTISQRYPFAYVCDFY